MLPEHGPLATVAPPCVKQERDFTLGQCSKHGLTQTRTFLVIHHCARMAILKSEIIPCYIGASFHQNTGGLKLFVVDGHFKSCPVTPEKYVDLNLLISYRA